MFKRFVATFTAVFLIFTVSPAFFQKVYAYQNNSYFTDLRIGLVSMSSPSAILTLGGEYTVNGQVYPSGTSFNIGISGTSITLNGTAQSQISLTPSERTTLLTITSGSVSNKYMGSFIIKLLNGKLVPINYVDIETYLKGVVSYEMSDNFPLESLKAQAVAARNYALSRIGYETAKGYDFDDTINYQVYKGFNPVYKNSINAVDQTRGQILLYNDKLVETLYSAWHGGASENSENVWGNTVPYLRSVQDTYESDPWPNGNRVLTNAQIQSSLTAKGYLTSTDTFLRLDLSSITKFTSGRVSNINIVYKNSAGLEQTKSVTKDSTRTFLSLPSNLYTVAYDSTAGAYTFSGKGNGHGLGMSQIGAKNRAVAGQTYDQILKFYYTGTYMQNLILKASLDSLVENTTALFTGSTISFSSTASKGNGYGYLFKYVVKNGTTVVFTKDYSSSNTLDFIPSSNGDYIVEAYVKDKFSISDYDDKKVSSFTVYNSPVLNGFSVNKTTTLVGQSVVSDTEVGEGSGSYLYKYEVIRDNVIVTSRDFTPEKQFIFTPDQSGNYVVNSYVKDSISTKPYDFKQSKSFAAFDSLTITSFSKDIENIFAGDIVNFQSAVNGGSGKGLSYKYVVLKEGQPISTRDFDNSSTFAFSPNSPGNYRIDVYALDAASENEYDASSSMTFSVRNRAVLSSLTSDRNISFTKDTVTIGAIGSSGDSLYKFLVIKDGLEVFNRDYSTSSVLQYTPQESGNYEVKVFIKDSLSLAEYDDTKSIGFVTYDYSEISSFTSDKSELLHNDTVHLSATGTKGSNSYLYKYVVSKDGSIVSVQNYSDLSTLNYTPILEGNYNISVYIKDVLSQKDYDDTRNININVYNPQLSTVTASGYFYEGKAVNLSAGSTDASPSGFLYRYEVYANGSLSTSSNFSSSGSFNFVPSTPGTYMIRVYGKDGISTNSYDSMKQFTLSINSKPLYLSTLPLSYGMTSNDVTALQNALIKLGYGLSRATGYFGSQTKSAVISFQSSRGLTADGVVGNMTYRALNDALIEKSGIKNLSY